MKSTYTLPGVFWDRKPESDIPKPTAYNLLVPEAGLPYCLFDVGGTQRSIRLTELFDVSNQNDMDRIAAKLMGCDTIAVIIDYQPQNAGSIQREFYRKRVRQIISLLETLPPGARVTIMESPSWERAS